MKHLFPILFVLIVSSGCGSVKPDAPDIVVTENIEVPEQPISLIKVPIKVNLKPYFDETNASIPTEFKGGENQCSGVSYKYHFKRAPIKFDGNGDYLSFSVNGKYSLSLNYCPECTYIFNGKGDCLTPRIYATCGIGEPMRKMYVSYNTRIGVTNDYKLDSKTKLYKVKAKSPCEITVFQYDASATLEKEVKAALKDLEKDIDKEISAVDLKPDMEATWNALCEPIDLKGYGFMYLKPSKVAIGDITFKGDTAYFDAFLKASPVIYSDRIEMASVPLPNLSSFDVKDGFDISMDISAKYDSLSSILTSSLSGMKTEIKGKEVIFGAIEVHGAANRQISIRVDFSGKKSGSLYLTGTPVFDAEKQHISFPDLEFDLKTKSALLKSAKWLFDKKITNLVRDAASMELAPYLEELKASIDESLTGEVDKGVYMAGKVEKVLINFIYPRENDLFIRIQSTGTLGIQM